MVVKMSAIKPISPWKRMPRAMKSCIKYSIVIAFMWPLNFAAWYTDVVTKAGLADYGPVKGTMVIKPYGYQLWENIRDIFDKMIKDTGHVNAYFPLFIPKSLKEFAKQYISDFNSE